MNEWGFIGQEIEVGIGKSATSFKFKSRRARLDDTSRTGLYARREVSAC
jgi:hypothetical protein